MTRVELDDEALARIGRALSDESRRRILVALGSGSRYPSELADDLGLTRANVSNHLACLRGCGLVHAAAEGRRVRYDLADPRLATALDVLSGLVLEVADGCGEQSQ